jgi:hypothetical protein
MRVSLSLSVLSLTLASIHAAPITGLLFNVPDAVAMNATVANVPSTAPNVIFEVNSPLNFTVAGSVSAFLASGGAFNIVGSAADLSRPLSNGVLSSLIEFMGSVTVTNGQTFTVTHDDGLTLVIGGITVINSPGPTAPVQTSQTYTGPSGTFPFTLVYGECCAGAAELQISLPFQPTLLSPEPSTFGLIAGGLLLVIGKFRRRRT